MLQNGDAGLCELYDLWAHAVAPRGCRWLGQASKGSPIRRSSEVGRGLALHFLEGPREGLRRREARLERHVDDPPLLIECQLIGRALEPCQSHEVAHGETRVLRELPVEMKLREAGDLAQLLDRQRL